MRASNRRWFVSAIAWDRARSSQSPQPLLSDPAQPLDATEAILDAELLSMQHRGVGLEGEDQAANRTSERPAALSAASAIACWMQRNSGAW